MRLAGVILALVILTLSSVAETLWVAQSSAGTDDGSSAANSKSVAWLNTAGSWGSGDAKVSAGDTVILTGTITNSITAQGSGTAGNVITIQFDTGAVMSSPVWPDSGAIDLGSMSYITLDGSGTGKILNTANGTALSNQLDSTGVNAQGGTHITIRNLVVTNLYERTAGSTNDGNRFGYAIKCQSVSDLTITSNKLADGDTMIAATWSTGTYSNWVLHGNTITSCNHGLSLGCSQAGSYMTNVVVSGNYIDGFDVWDGHSSLHLDGMIIFIEAPSPGYDGWLDGLKIFSNTVGPVVGTINTAGIFINCFAAAQIRSPMIYNNILRQQPGMSWSNGHIRIGPAMNGATNGLVANNYFEGDQPSGYAIVTESSVRFINNLCWRVGTPVSLLLATDYPGGWVANTNVYYDVYPSSGAFVLPGGGQTTWAGWQAAGQDLNSTTNRPSIDAGFAPTADDTVAKNKGVDLSAYFTTDFNGATRVAPWDIGAYEYFPTGGTAATAGTVNVGTLTITP